MYISRGGRVGGTWARALVKSEKKRKKRCGSEHIAQNNGPWGGSAERESGKKYIRDFFFEDEEAASWPKEPLCDAARSLTSEVYTFHLIRAQRVEKNYSYYYYYCCHTHKMPPKNSNYLLRSSQFLYYYLKKMSSRWHIRHFLYKNNNWCTSHQQWRRRRRRSSLVTSGLIMCPQWDLHKPLPVAHQWWAP